MDETLIPETKTNDSQNESTSVLQTDAQAAGKICPYCKTEIGKDDETVICSECGISHHKDCWEQNNGCAIFGCAGHSAENLVAFGAVCTQCGAPIGEENSFCPQCGAPKLPSVQNHVCAKCGAELTDGQEFCPSCGMQVGLTLDSGVSSAIEQFNANVDQKAKQKKGHKKLVVSLSIVVATVAILALCAGFGYTFLEKKADTVLTCLEENQIDRFEEAYDSLGAIGQTLFHQKIVTAFIKTVDENPYVNDSEAVLVDETILKRYQAYSEIADELDIPDDHSSHVVEYIDAVLALEEYTAYNNLYQSVYYSIGDYGDGVTAINNATNSYYYKSSYYSSAYRYITSAKNSASIYAGDDEEANVYVDNLETIASYAYARSVGSFTYASAASSALESISDLFDKIAALMSEVEDAVGNLPEIKVVG